LYRMPRGTRDILPEEQSHWRYIEARAAQLCQLYGYERIDTPVFEDSRLFVRSIGEETDIVQKEMYSFSDRSGSWLTLRPEGTAPVCRAYLEHGMHSRPQPVKLYYITPIFRYERPQAGRYRQHQQFGFEAMGDVDPALDAEVIEMSWRFYTGLGLENLVLKLNSIGCRLCRPRYLEKLKDYYRDKGELICMDCRRRRVTNPLRLLDCKKESCLSVAESAPKSSEHLCPECCQHLDDLRRYLGFLSLPFSLDHTLVRGLDYYTRTVFEIQPPGERGPQATLGGGGRYDDLIEELGGRPTPAVGFATGIERVILNLREQQGSVPDLPYPTIFVAYLGQEAKEEALKVASQLRGAGVGVLLAYGERSLKAQLRQANASGAKQAIIIGEEEAGAGVAVLRDMVKGEQKSVPRADLLAMLVR